TPRPTFEETTLLNPHAFSLSRHPEKTIRVWIAPYEDSDGVYHEAQHVWMVSAPGFWVKPTI
ncbi:TraV family lipoprotein, partial [Salmonella enterica]|uniref:TraV family lipoprotein n=1 Tax=Salmonella enterica TaxID=28901 RepID=UPI0032B5528A